MKIKLLFQLIITQNLILCPCISLAKSNNQPVHWSHLFNKVKVLEFIHTTQMHTKKISLQISMQQSKI